MPAPTEHKSVQARILLAKLKTELLVLAWREKRTTRAKVRVEIGIDAGRWIATELHR